MPALDSLKTLRSLAVDGKTYHYYSLPEAARTLGDLGKLPMSLKVLLENLLRWEDGSTVTGDDLKALAGWLRERRSDREIQYRPARVLMQDFTGVPAVVDLAAMRAAMAKAGGDPQKINPLSPVDLVIDHSVMVDKFASESAFEQNVEIEMQRNGERYAFLRWGQNAFDNFSVVPPGTGICHQVNLEYLGRTVWTKDEDGRTYAFPDTLVGTDSHTTMINGLGVLGWGVGGIEAEAAMLGQPVSMLIPEVIGFKLTGKLREGITATDLVLTVTQMLRKKGVVGNSSSSTATAWPTCPWRTAPPSPTWPRNTAPPAASSRWTRSPSATCACPDVRKARSSWSRPTARNRACGARRATSRCSPTPCTWTWAKSRPAWPDRSARRTAWPLQNVASAFNEFLGLQLHPSSTEEGRLLSEGGGGTAVGANAAFGEIDYQHDGQTHRLKNGAVVIAAITSCTNTSNPSVMMAAGLLAKKAVEKGLQRKPWVKSSLAPGSKVVTDYFKAAGLTRYLDELGFDLVGYGCTTCIGNSGPLLEPIEKAIQQADLTVASGTLRQPQLRRPRAPVGEDQLAGLAAAGGGLRPGRQRADQPQRGTAGHRQRRPAGLPEGHLAEPEGNRRGDPEGRHRDVPQRSTPRSSPATRNGRRSRCRSRTPTSGRPTPPTSSIHPSSNTSPRRRRPSPTSSRRGCWRCWATR